MNTNTPKCPACGRVKAVQRVADAYHCTACHKHFDDDPDEGSPEVYNDPVRSLIAKEEREANRRKQCHRR